MGEANSSVTRVWPVFDSLFAADPSGVQWLNGLLRMAPGFTGSDPGPLLPWLNEFDRKLPRNMKKVLGERATRIPYLRACFEVDYPPSEQILYWLLDNASSLTWPVSGDGIPQKYSDETQDLRVKLMEGNEATRKSAFDLLQAHGAAGSRKKWWAFEGFTSVDCVLESEHLLIFVEGKRTERISSATAWYPERNQIVRNIEVASAVARAASKDFAVIVCAEEDIKPPDGAFMKGLPHLSVAERKTMEAHYWGCITWRQIVHTLCPSLNLPRNLDDAVRICEMVRRKQ
jgi:hypothetical protein